MAQPLQITEEQRKQLEEKLKNMSPEELSEFQKQQCIFCQIIAGKIPSKKVYEDHLCIAVLDINPAAKGHLLIIPKVHHAIMPQVPDDALGHLFLISRHLSQILLKTMKSDGTNVFIANGPAAGQRAQHFMIHLIPRKEGDGLLEFEEKLVDHEMIKKIKSSLQDKLNRVLEVKEQDKQEKHETVKKADIAERSAEEEEKEIFITSSAAKRYHRKRCAFAQNIPSEKRIALTEEELAGSEKKPCTCVTGKKIPLNREKEVSDRKESGKTKKKEVKNEEESVSLDDIADLFK